MAKNTLSIEEIGKVTAISGPVIKIKGLPSVKMGELVLVGKNKVVIFKINKEFTQALLNEDFAFGLVLEKQEKISAGQEVKKTGELLKIPVGEEFLERVVNPLGKDLEIEKVVETKERRDIENLPPQIMDRGLVREPLETGIKVIDALFPIGRGQRELILGDRKIGKTTIALDAILNQKNLISIYCSIGQKKSEIVQVVQTLREYEAKNYIVVASSSSDSPVLQYLAPFSTMTLAEYFRDKGNDVLVVFDDLTKHAWIWRQICLLLETPPGREAYPGDIFYLHARLLERAGRLSKDKGGGSITALPICETKEGDITEYIPTNLISITDGQIYLENDLFQKGQIPAVNIGLSVSRIGSFAQRKCVKEVTGGLKLVLSQHKELKKLVQLETELSKESEETFKRAEILFEFFKQGKHKLMDVATQSVIYFAVLNGFFDGTEIGKVKVLEERFSQFLEGSHSEIKKEILEKGWTEEMKKKTEKIVEEFKALY